MSIIDIGTVVTPAYLSQRMDVAKWMVFLKQKSTETYQHSVRVALLSEKLSEVLGLDEREKALLRRGCFLHDIGKTMIPLSILENKPCLTSQQWTIMKLHPVLGAELVENHALENPIVLRMIQHHHERWDGSGYPEGLKGEEIPYFARICAVLDAFDDKMTSKAGKTPYTVELAMAELMLQSGTYFDEKIVRLFTQTSADMNSLYKFV
ncbi:HD-GYP domain-containing protein [Paenibacillus sp. GCM10027626]|uniref:HD-GYP domain-containing protein n=1 Tax=Paenibacillus sp. GCM10027626 TaxID=3273411 RepID=UPI00363BA3F2